MYLGESRALYFALRRHGTTEQVYTWLQRMLDRSDWKNRRDDEDEVLRKDYLRLWQECKHYDPNFVDQEMKRRQAAGRQFLVQERPATSKPQG